MRYFGCGGLAEADARLRFEVGSASTRRRSARPAAGKDFGGLAAQLSEDENSYVRKVAERSLDRRRKGQQTSSRRCLVLGSVADDYEMMERLHGTLATKMSRQIAERLYDVLVGSTIHNMRGL